LSDITSVQDEVILRLALEARTRVPEFREVLEEWPDANQQLNYPALSILSSNPPKQTPCHPWLYKTGVINGANKSVNQWVVGNFDWTLQLDAWLGNKPERNRFHELISTKLFMGQFLDSLSEVSGISLQLPNYHNIICRYDLIGYRFDDSEAGSQRQEWRIKMDVLAHCKQIVEKEEFQIVETEITDEFINTDVVIE